MTLYKALHPRNNIDRLYLYLHEIEDNIKKDQRKINYRSQ